MTRTYLTCQKKKGIQRHPDVCLALKCSSLRPVVTEADGKTYTKFFCSYRTRAEKLAQQAEVRKAKSERYDKLIEMVRKDGI